MDANIDERMLCAAPLAPAVSALLREAIAALHDAPRAERLLRRAQAQDPDCLYLYYALYKFYFSRRRLADAEHCACQALETAARLGGFPAGWAGLTAQCADWSQAGSSAYFYLFSLKALAFIRLRMGKTVESQRLLDKLRELDPRDRVGASVIRDLVSTASAYSAPKHCA
jgi:tetratricopeptide (TPR) repeat protein